MAYYPVKLIRYFRLSLIRSSFFIRVYLYYKLEKLWKTFEYKNNLIDAD